MQVSKRVRATDDPVMVRLVHLHRALNSFVDLPHIQLSCDKT